MRNLLSTILTLTAFVLLAAGVGHAGKGGKGKPGGGDGGDGGTAPSTEIAYTATFDRSYYGADELWVAGADGGKPRRIWDGQSSHLSDPEWSPDGTLLAVSQYDPQPTGTYVVSPDPDAVDFGVTSRISPLDLPTGAYVDPTWSPFVDGNGDFLPASQQLIAFQGPIADANNAIGIWVSDAAGSAAVEVTGYGLDTSHPDYEEFDQAIGPRWVATTDATRSWIFFVGETLRRDKANLQNLTRLGRELRALEVTRVSGVVTYGAPITLGFQFDESLSWGDGILPAGNPVGALSDVDSFTISKDGGTALWYDVVAGALVSTSIDYTTGVPVISTSGQQAFGAAVFGDLGRPYGVSIDASGTNVAFVAAPGTKAFLYTIPLGGVSATRVLSNKDGMSDTVLSDTLTAWQR